MVAARPDGTVVFANARWREITGIDHPTPDPLRGDLADHPPRGPPRPRHGLHRRRREARRVRDRLADRAPRRPGPPRAGPGRTDPRRGRPSHRVRGHHRRRDRHGRADRRPAPERRTLPQPHRARPPSARPWSISTARSSRSTRPTPPWSGRPPRSWWAPAPSPSCIPRTGTPRSRWRPGCSRAKVESIEHERRLLRADGTSVWVIERHHPRARRRRPAGPVLRPRAQHLRAQGGRGRPARAARRATAS